MGVVMVIKLISLVICSLLLISCNGRQIDLCLNSPEYIVTGQSNANMNWDYFENKAGAKVKNISRGGYTIQQLINQMSNEKLPCLRDLKGILLIHGEHDALWETDPLIYREKLEEYRLMIKDVSLYISLVGYTTNSLEDHLFDKIRNIQENSGFPNWVVSFKDANKFRDWGMLVDDIHYNTEGEKMVMDAYLETLFN